MSGLLSPTQRRATGTTFLLTRVTAVLLLVLFWKSLGMMSLSFKIMKLLDFPVVALSIWLQYGCSNCFGSILCVRFSMIPFANVMSFGVLARLPTSAGTRTPSTAPTAPPKISMHLPTPSKARMLTLVFPSESFSHRRSKMVTSLLEFVTLFGYLMTKSTTSVTASRLSLQSLLLIFLKISWSPSSSVWLMVLPRDAPDVLLLSLFPTLALFVGVTSFPPPFGLNRVALRLLPEISMMSSSSSSIPSTFVRFNPPLAGV
mmetsp:Transcript_20212/g.42359  ORF Transcript_20212/g.42359 Transcript_20212/m.42359 type:complete len:259 (-) Transcript_20212:3767-4543(-)